MTLEIVIPEANAKDRSVKDLVFTVLAEDTPKTLTQLHREIKRKYGKSATFQAVIKAVKSLIASNVVSKNDKLYSLNKDWIFETRNFMDRLYSQHFKVNKPMKRMELGKDVTVYTVRNLLELDRFWNDLLTQWSKDDKQDRVNAWMGRHAWWLIPRLQEEDLLHDFMLKKGVKVFNLFTGDTPLDRAAHRYYLNKGESTKIRKSLDSKTDVHIGAFGDTLLKFELPEKFSKKLDALYKKTKNAEELDVKHAIDLSKEQIDVELTVIKDKMLADRMKEEIRSHF